MAPPSTWPSGADYEPLCALQDVYHPGRDAGFADPRIGFIAICQRCKRLNSFETRFAIERPIGFFGAKDVFDGPAIPVVRGHNADDVTAAGGGVFREVLRGE